MYTNRKRSENDQYNETSNHIQMKGGDGSGPGLGGTRRCRRTLSFVYGLMSHCIDRFHFVFYFYTFHFMLPMCIWLIFLFIILNSFSSGRVCPPGAFEKWILILHVFKMQKKWKNEKIKIIEKMRADRAQILSYLSLKKVERLITFYQNTENNNSIKT